MCMDRININITPKKKFNSKRIKQTKKGFDSGAWYWQALKAGGAEDSVSLLLRGRKNIFLFNCGEGTDRKLGKKPKFNPKILITNTGFLLWIRIRKSI